MPKVSVVIPVYNVETYVKESVQSILKQSFKDIEIIIINDGSTDLSLTIIEELAKYDNRIQIISTLNNGLSVARNLGMYCAKGEYVYFFDSDDLLEENMLELCYQKCISNNLDFIFFDAKVFGDKNFSISKFNYTRTNQYKDKIYSGLDILKEQLENEGYRSQVCLNFIKKKYLLENNIFFYPKIIHEDELFTFILYLKAQRVGMYNASFFHRRVRENSIMTSFNNNEKSIFGYLTVCRELKYISQQVQTTKCEKELLDKRISALLSNVINQFHSVTNPYNKLIIKEFRKYINFKQKIKLFSPSIYTILRKFKYLIKDI